MSYIVTLTTDNQNTNGTLRYGIFNGYTDITFQNGLGPIMLASGEPLTITTANTIINNNTESTIIVDGSDNGGNNIFTIATTNVMITGLTIQNGTTFNNAGGIVVNNSSSVTVTKCIFNGNSGNTTDDIYNNATLTIDTSIFSSSSGGANIYNNGTTSITMSTFNSTADNGILSLGALTVNQSSFVTTSNTGITIQNTIAAVMITNSTFNTGADGINISESPNATINILNCTIYENSDNGISLATGNPGVSISIGNNIIYGNGTDLGNMGFHNSINSLGGNYIGILPPQGYIPPTNSCTDPTTDNINPSLTGSGQTIAGTPYFTPNPGSPVLNIGCGLLVSEYPVLQTDQIGHPRGTTDIDSGSIQVQSGPCYSGKSLILTRNRITGEIADIAAKCVYADVHEVYETTTNAFVPLMHNIISGRTNEYVLIKKDLLGPNKPTSDFYITGGHPIMIDGEEVLAQDILGGIKHKVKSEYIYTPCLANRTSIRINNLDVVTWSYNDWLEYVAKYNISWFDNKPIYHKIN